MSTNATAQPLVITCPKGLENLLVDELQQLGAHDIKMGVSYVNCEPDQLLAYRICMWSRMASRVLWPITQFEMQTADQINTNKPWNCHDNLNT